MHGDPYALLALAVRNTPSIWKSFSRIWEMMSAGLYTPEAASAAPKSAPAVPAAIPLLPIAIDTCTQKDLKLMPVAVASLKRCRLGIL